MGPACAANAGASSNWCAYETSTSCGCNSCTVAANSFRILDCSLNACGDRRLAEVTDLEEAAPATAQWGRRRRRFFDARRRRRRFFDNRRRRRRFFDYRRRRRRTAYPTPFPTRFPTRQPSAFPTTFPTHFPTRYPSTYPTPFPSPLPCDYGSHGCFKGSAGICYKHGGNTWGCGCKNTHWCSRGCSKPHAYHTCTLITPMPTPYPTPFPTPYPTAYPTRFPTAYPTRYPTRYPTTFPTSYPTPYPTAYPTPTCATTCSVKNHFNNKGGKFGKKIITVHDRDQIMYHHNHDQHRCYVTAAGKCKCICKSINGGSEQQFHKGALTGEKAAGSLTLAGYAEGTKFHKAITVFNDGCGDVNLGKYRIDIYHNGGIKRNFYINLPNKILKSGKSFNICNSISS